MNVSSGICDINKHNKQATNNTDVCRITCAVRHVLWRAACGFVCIRVQHVCYIVLQAIFNKHIPIPIPMFYDLSMLKYTRVRG